MNYKYEIALSFAGEDRNFAEAVAKGLHSSGINVFYDNFYAAELWGEDLSLKLREVYFSESRYCIMILSESYIEKMWTNHERQQAIERLLNQKGESYILPVRLDNFNGDVPGLSNLIGYLSVSRSNPQAVVDNFLKKIGKNNGKTVKVTKTISTPKTFIPNLKKGFTDKEKKEFLKKSFDEIVNLIAYFAKETHEKYDYFEYEIEKITSRKVLFTLYDKGNEITSFKIWLGGSFGDNSICYHCDLHIDVNNDNTMNESISLEEYENELKLNPLGMQLHGMGADKLLSPNETAEYLWKISCRTFS